MSAKDIVQEMADSILEDVADASDWTVQLHEPIWRNPEKGTQLNIYVMTETNAPAASNIGGGGFRTSGYHEDTCEIVVEYVEPARRSQSKKLKRDEEAELDLYDRAESLRAWADAHQTFPDVDVHRFDWISTSHAPQQRQELLVRFFQMTFQARTVHQYG